MIPQTGGTVHGISKGTARLAPTGVDEGDEESIGGGAHLRALRVPLHAEHPAVVAAFRRLHDVAGQGGGPQPRREALYGHRLVMAGVDAEAPGAFVDGGQAAGGLQGHLVPGGITVVIGAVAVQVLEEGAAEGHVEELVAAADGQDRQVTFQSRTEGLQFVGVPLAVGTLSVGTGALAVEARIDVDAPREEEAVEAS